MKLLLVLGGEPPSQALLSQEVAASDLIIAVDGGSKVFQRFNYAPHLLIGDLDSSTEQQDDNIEIIQIKEQNSTDLQKALTYVFNNYQPTAIELLGGTGGRVDHLVNNLQVCALINPKCQLEFVNDQPLEPGYSTERIIRITPHFKSDLRVNKGATLSVISVSQYSGLNSKGLVWEISESNSDSGYFSQSNLAKIDNPSISVHSGCVYLVVYQ